MSLAAAGQKCSGVLPGDGDVTPRIGGAKAAPRWDVRVIAATNKKLETEICRWTIPGKDLYYRLNVVPIHVSPPLREPPRRYFPLARRTFFLRQFRALTMGGGANASSGRTGHRAASRHSTWPGNVRELRNTNRASADFFPPARAFRAADVERLTGAAPRLARSDIGGLEDSKDVRKISNSPPKRAFLAVKNCGSTTGMSPRRAPCTRYCRARTSIRRSNVTDLYPGDGMSDRDLGRRDAEDRSAARQNFRPRRHRQPRQPRGPAPGAGATDACRTNLRTFDARRDGPTRSRVCALGVAIVFWPYFGALRSGARRFISGAVADG